ncbi:MAG: anti-sigma factor [Chloroflexota bacterium]|nr:anti-sigma factor [Chloroflexota bacterium]MDQ5864773.1 anti-sigma factor [Chloroflexota bacterium]
MNNSNDSTLEDNWESRLIEYSMGTMSPSDAQEFERQLNECRVHVKLADQYTQVVGWMGAAATPADPPSGHKTRMMARLAATEQEQAPATSAATLSREPIRLHAVGSEPEMTAYSGSDGSSGAAGPAPVTSLDEYRTKRASRPMALWIGSAAAVLALLVVAGWLTAFLGRPHVPDGTLTVAVQSQPGAPENSGGVLFYNPDSREAHFYANGLQALSAEQVYEMWLLPKGGGDPVPAGIFNAGTSGTARHAIQAPAAMGDYAGVAVSVEKAPGSTVVGGPVILVGQYETQN